MSYYVIILFSLVLCAQHLSAQSTSEYIYIDSISLSGNKKTKTKVLLRELEFAVGDSIALIELSETLKRNEFLLLNTGLLVLAQMNVKNWQRPSNKVCITIEVSETWYIYPIPVLSLADRNFNVWWEEHNRSINRINFGMNLYWSNFTGNRDFLKMTFQYGFTQKYELDYAFPYINKKQTLGINGNIFYARNRNVNYLTQASQQVFFKDESSFLLKRFRLNLKFTYRPLLRAYHRFGIRYQHNTVDERIAQELNPDFFLQGQSKQEYFSMFYSYTYDNRNFRAYPTNGNFFSAHFQKSGLGITQQRNNLTLTLQYRHYFFLSNKWSLEWLSKSRLSFIRIQQPFFNGKGLGYGEDYLRGYEFYVIDGEDFLYTKPTLRFNLLNRILNWGKIMFLNPFKIMPLKIYLKMYGDAGAVNQPFYKANNPLSNRFLYSGGLGLDVLIYNDKMLQFEYSVNHLGKHGLFLHWNVNF